MQCLEHVTIHYNLVSMVWCVRINRVLKLCYVTTHGIGTPRRVSIKLESKVTIVYYVPKAKCCNENNLRNMAD